MIAKIHQIHPGGKTFELNQLSFKPIKFCAILMTTYSTLSLSCLGKDSDPLSTVT